MHLVRAIPTRAADKPINLYADTTIPMNNLKVGSRLALAFGLVLLIAALVVGSSLLCTTKMTPTIMGIPALGFFGYIFALGMSVWLFFKMLPWGVLEMIAP